MTVEKAREILKLPDTVPDEKILKILELTKTLAQIYIQQNKQTTGIIQK